MSDIVNLNRFRKAKQRSDDAQRASENRVRFGRGKLEKARARDEVQRREKALDGKEIAPHGSAARKDGPSEEGK